MNLKLKQQLIDTVLEQVILNNNSKKKKADCLLSSYFCVNTVLLYSNTGSRTRKFYLKQPECRTEPEALQTHILTH